MAALENAAPFLSEFSVHALYCSSTPLSFTDFFIVLVLY